MPDTGLFDLGARELGQLLLSALWAITGVAALVVGLRRDDRALRLGSLALLLVTVGKVFLYDLAALTSLYRVGSFIGLGLLLLVAAGIWQRMRRAHARPDPPELSLDLPRLAANPRRRHGPARIGGFEGVHPAGAPPIDPGRAGSGIHPRSAV